MKLARFDTLEVGDSFKFDPFGVTVCEKSKKVDPVIDKAGSAKYKNQISKYEFFVKNDELVIVENGKTSN